MPNFVFYGGREQATTKLIFISLSELGYGPLKFSFMRVRLVLTKYVRVRIIAVKTERMQIHFLSNVLVVDASLDLKVPIAD